MSVLADVLAVGAGVIVGSAAIAWIVRRSR